MHGGISLVIRLTALVCYSIIILYLIKEVMLFERGLGFVISQNELKL